MPCDFAAKLNELVIGECVFRFVYFLVQDLGICNRMRSTFGYGNDMIKSGRLRCELPPREGAMVFLLF